VIEDYVVLYFGSSVFKIARLLFVALLSVHFFACTFYRVKNDSAASPDDVEAFYTSKGVSPNVSRFHCVNEFSAAWFDRGFDLQSLSKSYVSNQPFSITIPIPKSKRHPTLISIRKTR
jgi:hypothetical protein